MNLLTNREKRQMAALQKQKDVLASLIGEYSRLQSRPPRMITAQELIDYNHARILALQRFAAQRLEGVAQP